MNQTSISDLIARVQNRIRMRAALKGAAITLIVAVISLIAASLLALKITPGLAGLTALRALPIVLAAASAWLFIWKPTRAKIDSARIARLIEEKCAMEDRLERQQLLLGAAGAGHERKKPETSTIRCDCPGDPL